MTTMSFRLASGFNGRRCGLTLIEIMSAIMVLAIGLVGVLAAIPFGGFRLAQMNEADNSSLVGRDAVRMMKTNGWANPDNWFLYIDVNQGGVDPGYTDPRSVSFDNVKGKFLNLTFPFIVDPLSVLVRDDLLPRFSESSGDVFYTKVTPRYGYPDYKDFLSKDIVPENRALAGLCARFDRSFYLQDDLLSGVDDSEDDTFFRPFLELENDAILNPGGDDADDAGPKVPSFTGRYSWLATVRPNSNTEPFYYCSLSDVGSADYDVVVFKDRSMNDERIVSVTIDGTGYQGGSVTVDLDDSGVEADDDRARVLSQLETTKYIMLMGNEDVPIDGHFRKFARWYRIANYSVDDGKIRMSLIGPNTPTLWAGKTVSGIFFPGVVGVYSGSTSF